MHRLRSRPPPAARAEIRAAPAPACRAHPESSDKAAAPHRHSGLPIFRTVTSTPRVDRRSSTLARDLQTAISEFRIAQAIAEGIKRLAGEIAIGAALHAVIVERRQLIHACVKSHRQMPGRIVVARQGLADGGAAFLARIPGIENGIGIAAPPSSPTRPSRSSAPPPASCRSSFTALSRSSSSLGMSRLVRSPPIKPGTLTGISSPSSAEEMPTTAITTSAAFAAATAFARGLSIDPGPDEFQHRTARRRLLDAAPHICGPSRRSLPPSWARAGARPSVHHQLAVDP